MTEKSDIAQILQRALRPALDWATGKLSREGG